MKSANRRRANWPRPPKTTETESATIERVCTKKYLPQTLKIKKSKKEIQEKEEQEEIKRKREPKNKTKRIGFDFFRVDGWPKKTKKKGKTTRNDWLRKWSPFSFLPKENWTFWIELRVVLTGFYRVLPSFTEFYRVLPSLCRVRKGFTEYYWELNGFQPSFT